MNLPMQRGEALDQYASAGVVGSDSLFQHDPAARVAYSANPQFSLNATQAHPIRSAAESLLTQPEIAEAMEAVFLLNRDPLIEIGAHLEESETPLDSALAMCGLRWLRDNLTQETVLRRSVIDAKSKLSLQSDRIAERRHLRLVQADPEQPEEVSSARTESMHSKQSSYRAMFDEAISSVGETAPHLEVDALAKLCHELNIHEGEDGFMVEERRSYRSRLSQRTADYLADPNQLINDLLIIGKMGQVINASSAPALENVILAYLKHASRTSGETLSAGFYDIDDLTGATVNKWLEAISSLSADYTRQDFANAEEARDPNALVIGIAMRKGSSVFSNSLQRAAQRHPKLLIDKLYMLCDNGLKPGDDLHNELVLAAVEYCLTNEPLARGALVVSPTTGVDKAIQERSIDLQLTLSSLGVPPGLVGIQLGDEASDSSGNNESEWTLIFSQGQRHILRKLSPNILASRDTSSKVAALEEMAVNYQASLESLKQFAITPAGREQTLAGKHGLFDQILSAPIEVSAGPPAVKHNRFGILSRNFARLKPKHR